MAANGAAGAALTSSTVINPACTKGLQKAPIVPVFTAKNTVGSAFPRTGAVAEEGIQVLIAQIVLHGRLAERLGPRRGGERHLPAGARESL